MENLIYSKKIVDAYEVLSKWIVFNSGLSVAAQVPTRPCNVMEADYYRSIVLPREFYELIKKLNTKGVSYEKIAETIKYPTTISHWLYFPALYFGKFKDGWARGLSIKEGIGFIESIINLLFLLRKNDPFCKDSTNLILEKKDVEKIMKTQKFIKSEENPEIRKILPRLNLTLFHYGIILQAGARAHAQEMHGPYKLDNKKVLFVKEFIRLKPEEVWNFASDFPYTKITSYEVYEESTNIQIDMLGHLKTVTNPYQKLVKVAVKGDETNLDWSELTKLYEKSTEALEKGNSVIKSFKREDWIKKWIEMSYFLLKPLKELLNEAWYPPKHLLKLTTDEKEIKKCNEGGKKYIQVVRDAITNLSKEKAVKEITQAHLKTIYGR